MSTSKGRGAAAHRIVEVVPPEQLRLLFLRPRPQSAIEFDPEGTDAIPRLFDEFDRLAARDRRPRGQGQPAAVARVGLPLLAQGARCRRRRPRRPRYRPSFSHVATLVQVKPVEPDLFAAEKGAPLSQRRGRDPRRADRRGAPVARDVRPGVVPDRRPARGAAGGGRRPRRRPARLPRRARRRRRADRAGGRRRLAGADLLGRRRARAAQRPRLRRRSTSPSSAGSNGPRAGWLLAGLDRPFVARPAARGRAGDRSEATGMSVGLQRLREDAATDPPGGDRQGRGRRRSSTRRSPPTGAGASCSAEGDRLKARAQPGLEGGRRGRPAAAPTRTARRSPRSRPRPSRPASGSRRSTPSSPTVEAELDDLLLRIPNPADPDVPVGGEEANVTVREWGDQLPASPAARAARSAPMRPPAARPGSAGRTGRSASGSGSSTSSAARRSPAPGFPVYRGLGARLAAVAHQLVPRRPQHRERVHRDLAAGGGQRRLGARDRPDPGQGRPDVRRRPATTCT